MVIRSILSYDREGQILAETKNISRAQEVERELIDVSRLDDDQL